MKKQLKRNQAREQMLNLFAQARKEDIASGTDLIRKARRIQQKFRFRLPREIKRGFCKHCYTMLVPGKNARVRTQPGHIVITCDACKRQTRIPLNAKRPVPSRTKKRVVTPGRAPKSQR